MRSLMLTPIFLILPLLTGCQTDTAYHTYRSTGSDGWRAEDTLVFRLPSTLTSSRYTFQIGVKHTGVYPYKDLWVTLLRPGTEEAQRDTFHLHLADEKGNWKGKGTQSSSFQFVSEAYTLTLEDPDTLLRIVHLMDTVRLKGITDVGVRLANRQEK